MRTFQSIEKLDTGILYCLELASSISVLLLAFGLIASMANVLTKGSVLSHSALMQQVWAWTQCIAIDAGLSGTILRTFRYYREGEKVRTWIYGLLSALLLFTAAIVSNIEAVQQTLNITLEAAYVHVFVPVETLIWIRSVAIVLLIVAHAMRHMTKTEESTPHVSQPEMGGLSLTPELLDALRALLMQTVVAEEKDIQQALPTPVQSQETAAFQQDEETAKEETAKAGGEQRTYERVKAYLTTKPDAKIREVAEACHLSMSTANKWMGRVKKDAE